MVYPCIPHFCYIKVGLKGVYIALICFPDARRPLLLQVNCNKNRTLENDNRHLTDMFINPRLVPDDTENNTEL